MSDSVTRIADDPLAIIKRRPTLREVKDSEVLWLVAEVDRLRSLLMRLEEEAGSRVTNVLREHS